MSGVIVNYNNNALTSMSSSGTKTLLTSGKYCEGNFEVVYSAPALSSLTVTPTETAQTFNATGVYGYKPVTVNAISSTYVGTGVSRLEANTYYPRNYNQTISSKYYLSGKQTIASVITTNLSASNIKSGVTVKIGDTSNASGVAQVTGTYNPINGDYAIKVSGTEATNCTIEIGDGSRTTMSNGAIYFCNSGDTILVRYVDGGNIYYNGTKVKDDTGSTVSYRFTAPSTNLNINCTSGNMYITDEVVSTLTVTPTETAQTFNATGVYGYKPVTVNAISSTYIGTGVAKKSSTNTTFASTTGTFTAPAGYYSTAATKTITTQAAQTIYPSTATQYINSYRWLTGTQTIASVTTSNLTAENIAEGVVVKVGDANNASRITQVTGTHSGSQKHTITIDGTGDAAYCYVTYNNQKYYSNSTFEYEPGDTLTIHCRGNKVFLNYTQPLLNSNYSCDYILPDYAGDITIKLYYSTFTNNSVYIYTTYEKYYAAVNAIAINTTNGLDNDIPGFSSYIANLLNIRSGMFAERDFNSGTYIFQSASAVGYYAFNCEHRDRNVKETTFYFPNCTIIHGNAFTHRHDFKSIYFPICSSVEYGAFSSCSGLTTISFPECTTIASYAFYSCSALSLASFPKCTLLSDKVFVGCKQLSKVYFPLCTSIPSYAFNQCGIISVSSSDFSNCTTIRQSAFMACMSLMSVNFPQCTLISNSAFYNCYSLASVSFSKCDYIGASAFQYCSALTSVNFPNCTYVGPSAFGNCASLTIASFPKCASFAASAFTSCYNLISLYLTGVSSVPILSNVAVFYSTPISTYSTVAGRYGSIFVPSSLYAAFTTATSWSAYAARMVSV